MKEIEALLKRHGQEHLLLKYNELNEKDKETLINQIKNIDFDLMKELYEKAKSDVQFDDCEIEPIEHISREKMSKLEIDELIKLGINSIQENEYAVVTMAGGQGTRLGHAGPKGTYALLKEGNTLFELLCDHLKEAAKKYNTFINWYIMTSEQNHNETVEFFEANNYFDYPKNYVKFFIQGKLPMLGENGDILLDETGLVKEASNGHGGTLNTLKKTGILEEMKERGFKWIYISGVDNVLAKLVDPFMIGYSIKNDTEITVKSVEKADPKEKAGALCKKNGNTGVIEYTEISDEMANLRNNYGSLVYGDINILLNLFNIEALDKICEKRLPYHTAHKKADYLDKNGVVVKATEPNAYKFESFIFDSFEMLDNVKVLRVKREDEFAPLKNAEGADSPETAKKLYTDYMIKKHAYENYQKWCKDTVFDEQIKSELNSISGNEIEIIDRFYKELEFGTAGLRGIMGAGTNRMNKYTVTKATQGLANYIIKKNLENKPVVIGYDTRNNSKEFANEVALTFNANGIKTLLFDKERPVPMLSYATRILKASFGIMVTASHNPSEYNGYKVFGSNGAQIINPVDKEIIKEVNEVKKYSDIKTISREKAESKELYVLIGSAIEQRYYKELTKLMFNVSDKAKEELKIVYSPLFGTGNIPVRTLLEKQGYSEVYVVAEQELPNGNFPNLKYPNPEELSAMNLAINLSKEVDADICFATDPDADRLGIMVKDKQGKYEKLTGNQIASLMLKYILENKKLKNELAKNSVIVSTIVSTNLTKKIAKKYNVEYLETLTGFKYMGNYIDKFEKTKEKQFIFGFEESYGFLYGTHARDKDGIVASLLIVEMAAYYKSKGKTLIDVLNDIYKEYGYCIEDAKSIILKGQEGEMQIKAIMESLRENMPKDIFGIRVLKAKDYKLEKIIDFETNNITKTDLPNSNVIYLELEDDAFVAIRPSGTEPKLKFYMGVFEESREKALEKLDKIKKFVDKQSRIITSKQNKLNVKSSKKI